MNIQDSLLSRVAHGLDRARQKQRKLKRELLDVARRAGGADVHRRVEQVESTIAFVADPRKFLDTLRDAVLAHEAVNHPLLARVAHVPFTREDYRIFGLQHYALVGTFTLYLEHLLVRGPSSDAKQWLAKVLVDEYGEGSEGKDHAELYREFLCATGAVPREERRVSLHPDVTGFIAEHLRICQHESFLVGLGAVGPGHEWSIPKMFVQIVRGLRRAGFREDEIRYFTLHMAQDQDHGAWLEEALLLFATTPDSQQEIWRGAMLSLRARAKLWSAVQDKIVRWRQPKNLHLRSQARSSSREGLGELTLEEWQAQLARAHVVGAAERARP
ncbi:MAG: iron-containing redox enzyme family protein [Deltaproteobacteria bacterium]|nr:iron-containing redox enzyme family protein [Deltaproteobacteria bacterium]